MTHAARHVRHAEEDSQKPASPSLQPTEPSTEQDGAPGANTQDSKRHLHENVSGKQAEQHPESPAGQHATGSFTGGKRGK